jgi:response regulator of citrate/malate metabolism
VAVQEFDFASGKVLDPKRKQALLAVESDADAELLKETLRQKGFQFMGREADLRSTLELVRKHKLGVLFLDGDLPGVKLNELVPSIKKAFPDFSIIVVSSEVTKELLSEVLRLGALGFLVKPVQTDALEKVLTKLK